MLQLNFADVSQLHPLENKHYIPSWSSNIVLENGPFSSMIRDIHDDWPVI